MTYPQYPQSGGMPSHPGYADGEPPASGGTAITAGVLAILGGLYAIWQAFVSFGFGAAIQSEAVRADLTPEERVAFDDVVPDWVGAAGIGMGGLQLLLVVLLLVGAIMLFLKKPAGRWMVVAGCGLAIAGAVVAYVMVDVLMSDMIDRANEISGSQVDTAGATTVMNAVVGIGALIVSIPAVVTLVLALLPSTARWCAQGTRKAAPAYGSYGQYPPVGQQPQQW